MTLEISGKDGVEKNVGEIGENLVKGEGVFLFETSTKLMLSKNCLRAIVFEISGLCFQIL